MTEETIEVNGLDVTKCTHLSDCLLCDYTENHSQFCSDYDNCYYKQLKRLQAENERLKEEIYIARENYGLEMEFQMRYRKALEEIRELFCVGRTFYEGYFDNDNLSRADKTIKIINEVLK